MKQLLLLSVLLIASGSALAQPLDTQMPCPKEHSNMVMPLGDDQSPFDFNHSQSGGEKSDNLGVPYYQACSSS